MAASVLIPADNLKADRSDRNERGSVATTTSFRLLRDCPGHGRDCITVTVTPTHDDARQSPWRASQSPDAGLATTVGRRTRVTQDLSQSCHQTRNEIHSLFLAPSFPFHHGAPARRSDETAAADREKNAATLLDFADDCSSG
jgi:hypothetical protein